MEPTSSEVVVATADDAMLDEILRLCAAAAVTPEVVGDGATMRRLWRAASLVVLGAEIAAQLASAGLPRREHVVLVIHGQPVAEHWRLAVATGAADVVGLPDHEGWLVHRLADVADGGRPGGLTVGVMGGRGGAGTSTLAAGLALAAVRADRRTTLIDADRSGGGLDLLLGCEDHPGLRWSDLASTQGRVSARALRAALPAVGGLAVLSWDRSDIKGPTRETMRAVLSAGARGSDLLVVDLPREPDGPASEALAALDLALLLVPAEVRAVAGARSSLALLRQFVPDVRLVVRDAKPRFLDAEAVASSLALPLAGEILTQRSVFESVEQGMGLAASRRLARACAEIVRSIVPQHRPTTAGAL